MLRNFHVNFHDNHGILLFVNRLETTIHKYVPNNTCGCDSFGICGHIVSKVRNKNLLKHFRLCGIFNHQIMGK